MSLKRTRILFITGWYPNRYDPQIGVFIRKHASAVAKFCDVALLHVFSDAHPVEKKYELVSENDYGLVSVIVYFKKHTSSFLILNKLVNFIRHRNATLKGLKYIRRNFGDHDITHAYILLRPALTAYLLKLFRMKQFVISEQWSGFATGKYKEKNWFARYLTRIVLRKANAVTVVSEFLKCSMISNGLEANYTVIPNIIEPPALKDYPGNVNKIRILTVADLVDEIKNVSGVLKALSEIIAANPNIEFHIIGEGKDRAQLELLASGLTLLNRHVIFEGIKSNNEVYDSLMKCDFLVMNSNFETFSLICAEAISCGKPVIATRCGGPQEFVTEETGILIDPGNHGQLVGALQQMIYTYRSYDTEKLKRYAVKKFSAEIVGEKFYNVYTTILTK